MFHLQSGISPFGTAILRVSLIRLYFRIRSLAVLEVRDGDAFTCERKGTTFFTGMADFCGVNTCAAEEKASYHTLWVKLSCHTVRI